MPFLEKTELERFTAFTLRTNKAGLQSCSQHQNIKISENVNQKRKKKQNKNTEVTIQRTNSFLIITHSASKKMNFSNLMLS